jgi:hypothetical protein
LIFLLLVAAVVGEPAVPMFPVVAVVVPVPLSWVMALLFPMENCPSSLVPEAQLGTTVKIPHLIQLPAMGVALAVGGFMAFRDKMADPVAVVVVAVIPGPIQAEELVKET